MKAINYLKTGELFFKRYKFLQKCLAFELNSRNLFKNADGNKKLSNNYVFIKNTTRFTVQIKPRWQ